jgi:hypothetical protein
MSTNLELEADEVCASCGMAAIDNIKLKLCDGGCDLVKYCSDGCQELHRPEHIGVCKKRKAELRDRDLFTQPDSSHWGECPICCLPLSIDPSKSTLMGCCCKVICKGCSYANKKREKEAGLERRCVFCREPVSKSEEEYDKRVMKRIKKNDPVAMTQMGKISLFEKGDHEKALEYFAKAAELGNVDAHACLGRMYYRGNGVEKDEEKAVYHLEQAAIGGHTGARGLLACYEMDNGRFERAAKHFMIAANLGCDISLQQVKDLFEKGIVSKEEYAAARRGYQTAVDATESAERDEQEAYFKMHASQRS